MMNCHKSFLALLLSLVAIGILVLNVPYAAGGIEKLLKGAQQARGKPSTTKTAKTALDDLIEDLKKGLENPKQAEKLKRALGEKMISALAYGLRTEESIMKGARGAVNNTKFHHRPRDNPEALKQYFEAELKGFIERLTRQTLEKAAKARLSNGINSREERAAITLATIDKEVRLRHGRHTEKIGYTEDLYQVDIGVDQIRGTFGEIESTKLKSPHIIFTQRGPREIFREAASLSR